MNSGGCSAHIVSPDHNRHYILWYCLFLLAGLIWLYRDFIFSDGMFRSYDMINAGVFFRSFLVRHLAEFGGVPLWNPYILCGLPYIDAIHGDIFYPLSFLKLLLPVPRAFGWTVIFHVYLAGIFAYLAARELKLSKPAAATAGVAYMFSGWLNSLVMPGHDCKIYVTALFPLVILFIHRSYRLRPFINLTMVGVVIGCLILSPHPQMAYFAIVAATAYYLVIMLTHLPERGRFIFIAGRSGYLIFAVVLGLALGAIQFWPAYHYTRNYSPRVLHQQSYNFASGWSLHAEEAFSLVVPEFAGADIGKPGTVYWGRNGMKDNSEYAGVAALMLAVIGLAYYRRRRDKFFFAFVAGAALIYALGDTTPAFRYIYKYVPFVKMTRAPSMIMFLFSFAVSMLAGMGVEGLLRRRDIDAPRRSNVLLYALLAVPAFLFTGWYLFAGAGREMLASYAGVFYPGLLNDPAGLQAAEANLPAIRSGFAYAGLFALSLAVMALLSHWKRVGLAVIMLMPVLIMADGIRFNRRFVQMADYENTFAATPLVKFLQDNIGYHRVFGHGLDEIQLHLYDHQIPSPKGYHGNELLWYYRLLTENEGLVNNCINPRFSRLTGVKYILTPAEMDLTPLGYDSSTITRRATFEGIDVVENRRCFPRAYLVGQYHVIPNTDSIFRLIYHGQDDLHRLAYLEEEPKIGVDSIFSPGDTAVIEYYSPDSVVIRASCSAPKILTLSDNYYKDWHVVVDGTEKEMVRTYGCFRGVILDSGNHTVVWNYVPSAYAVGRWLTLSATIFVFFSLIFSCLGFRRL